MVGRNQQELSAALRDASTPIKLVLFDIDGTLSSGGKFTRALSTAIGTELGLAVTTEELEERIKAGKTSREELAIIVEKAGVPKERQKEAIEHILTSAYGLLKRELSNSPLIVLEGVTELLGQLNSKPDTVLGVVTNNTKAAMEIKLASSGLIRYFPQGSIMVCAEDGGSKKELVEFAITKAESALNARLKRSSVFYFGDQVSDVIAGKLAGAVAIGVATGRSTFDELVRAGADVVLHKLSESNSAMAAIYGAQRPTARSKRHS